MKYWIAMSNGCRRQIEGEPVLKSIKSIECFLHRSYNGNAFFNEPWSISEVSSGKCFIKGRIKRELITDARELLLRVGGNKITAALKEFPKVMELPEEDKEHK